MDLHFAGVPEYSPAHVMLMASVGQALRRRGHRFTLFQAGQVLSSANEREVDLCALDRDGNGSINQGVANDLRFLCKSLPDALSKAGVNCVVVDSMMPAGAAVAEALGLPFVTLSPGTPINSEPKVPPPFAPWGAAASFAGQLRNRIAYCARDAFLRPALGVLNEFRASHKLPAYGSPEDSLSRLAQITPLVKEFDFARERLPAYFHYLGPFERTDPPSAHFPYERLTGQPLIYFSCGTVSAMQHDALKAAAVATREMGAQMVVATGHTNPDEKYKDLPSHVIQVGYAPQRALLRKSAASVTHCGLNSTLESLMAGAPILAIPKLRFDHPGVAARIAHHEVGIVLNKSERQNPAVFRERLEELLYNPRYRERARAFQKIIGQTTGAEGAASIVERAARTRKPVESLERPSECDLSDSVEKQLSLRYI